MNVFTAPERPTRDVPPTSHDQELRRLLFAVVTRLERHLEQASYEHHYVQDGLGI